MNRRYIPVLLTAFYWSAWAGIIWWDQHTPKVTNPQLLTATPQPAVVSLASTAQSSDLPILPAVQAELIPTKVVSERRPAEAEIFYDDPYTRVTVSRGVALHAEPLISSPALDYLPRGQEFKLLRLENGWAEVLHPDTQKRGWVWHVYLAPSNPVIAQAPADSHDPKLQSPPDPTEMRPQRAFLELNVEQIAHRGMVNPGEVKVHRKRFARFLASSPGGIGDASRTRQDVQEALPSETSASITPPRPRHQGSLWSIPLTDRTKGSRHCLQAPH